MTTHQDPPAAAGRRAAVRDREDAVVTGLQSLATALDGEPDPEFRAATRARLVAMAAVRSPQPAPRSRVRRLLAHAPRPVPAWRSRVTAGLAAGALAVTALASLVAISANARPGDALYGLKRGTEQTQLALAGDARGQTLLEFATTRLSELDALVGSGGSSDGTALLSTLRTMDAETTEGAAWLTSHAVATRSASPTATLANWTSGQSAGLSALVPAMPAGTRASAEKSLTLLQQVGLRAAALGTAVGCPGGPATNGTDALGPVPAACPSTAAPGTAQPSAPGAVPPGTGAPGTNPETAPAPAGTLPTTGPATPVPSGQLPAPSAPVPTAVPLPVPLVPVPAPALPLGGSTTSSATAPPLIPALPTLQGPCLLPVGC